MGNQTLSLGAAAALVLAQVVTALPREVPNDPYLPRAEAPRSSLPVTASTCFGVQVNVSPLGANIPGDAANEPSIAVDPTAPNRIVIGWRQFDTVLSDFRQAGWAYSHDGGRTWTFPGVLEPGGFGSDPVLRADAEGTFYYCSLSLPDVRFFKSIDGGVTWGPPLFAFGGDKQWFTIDRTGGAGHGNIYMSWSGGKYDDIFTRSTDGGDSFLTPLAIFGSPRWGQLDVTSDGTLFLGGVVGLKGYPWDTFLVVGSTNAQDPLQVPDFDVGGVVDLGGPVVAFAEPSPNPGGILGQVNLAVDTSAGPTHGNVYLLCSVDPAGADPLDVMFARSTDGGLTWSPPVRVNDDAVGNWQWFGTMSVAPNGRIDVVWNDTRNSGVVNLCQLFHASSTDGGAMWSANAELGPLWDSLAGWAGDQHKIGDYYDMTSDLLGADLAYAATCNGEQDVYFLRIGEYDCNSNGAPDGEDLASGTSEDCNANGMSDECEVAAGTSSDVNGNGVPDECECLSDIDGDSGVGVMDLLALLGAWGPNPGHPADVDGDENVGLADLEALLASWGPC